MLVTQRNVTRSIVASEQQAVKNVLNLLIRDSEARWGALLSDKITTVRNGRDHLVQLGTTMQSVLTMYADQVDKGQIDTKQAHALAKAWLDKLALNAQSFSLILDPWINIVYCGRRSEETRGGKEGVCT